MGRERGAAGRRASRVRRRAGRGRAGAAPAQRVVDRADHERPHQAGIAEAHLGLGRMDVDVDEARIARDARAPAPDGGRRPWCRHRRRAPPTSSSRSRTGRPLTTRWMWSAAPRWKVGRPTWPVSAKPSRASADRQRVGGEVRPEHRGERGAGCAVRLRPRPASDEAAAGIGPQREADRRVGHGEAPQDLGDGRRSRPGRISGTSAGPASRRTGRVTSIRVPRGAGGRPRPRPCSPASTVRRRAGIGVRRRGWRWRAAPPRRSRAAPRRGSRACRIAGEVAVRQLRGGVALDRELEVVRRPCRGRRRRRGSAAGRRPRPSTSIGAGAGIDRVLDQLLDGRGRPLHHLAGRDAVDEDGVEAADVQGCRGWTSAATIAAAAAAFQSRRVTGTGLRRSGAPGCGAQARRGGAAEGDAAAARRCASRGSAPRRDGATGRRGRCRRGRRPAAGSRRRRSPPRGSRSRGCGCGRRATPRVAPGSPRGCRRGGTSRHPRHRT